jgi:hypothetical protein
VYDFARDPSQCPDLDRHAVYLGTPGPDPSCPAGEISGKTESVQLMPINRASPDLRAATRPAIIGSQAALTNSDSAITHTIIDILPSAGVEVSLSYGHHLALVRAIQATIRVHGHRSAAAVAESVRPAVIPAAVAQGIVRGAGFDTCAAPSAATMRKWLASPYRSIGVYIGGINRGCAQANLTANWLAAIQRQGWHYFPFYVGPQASCVEAVGDAPINPAEASAEGTEAADDAAQQAEDLGIPPGTPLIYDMEAYDGCGDEVIEFLSAWDLELHADGYAAGVYESFSNIGDLISAQGQIVEPDVIHYADWDGKATTTSSYMPQDMWIDHQRLHQYTGGSYETWGGARMDIDNDELNVNLDWPASSLSPGPPPYSQPFPLPFPYSP